MTTAIVIIAYALIALGVMTQDLNDGAPPHKAIGVAYFWLPLTVYVLGYVLANQLKRWLE